MSTKLVVGSVTKGLRNDVLPFNIDNDSFPKLLNAYQWRARLKRKRGSLLLGRLRRYFNSTSSAYTGTTLNPTYRITFDGSGNANLTGPYTNATPVSFSLQTNATFEPGTITITGSVGPITYTDPTQDGFLTPTGTGGPNTINYATGAIHIPAQAGGTATVSFNYFPDLPVMGLEDLVLLTNAFEGTLAFDTTYSYNINTTSPFTIFNVSFYKNPSAITPTVPPGYTPKGVWTPLTWNGQDYQQFWTTNYQGSLWATNGVEVPFDTTNVGMQFKPIVTTTIFAAGPPARVTLQITAHGLVVGDFVFVNEVLTTTGINYQTGFVDTVTDANNVIVQFPTSTVANNGTGGIAQYLTNRSDPTKDCIRFYDGAPVTSASPPTFIPDHGWVNFMPPLILAPETIFSIADQVPGQYYLVGAKAMLQFKDRLLFFGPIIQTSTGVPKYLQDTIIYCQNGTPYYTTTFPYNTVLPTAAVLASAVYFSLLVPVNQTATANTWFENIPGYGSFATIGIDEPITTVVSNEDVLVLGFTNNQVRLVYTGNDIVPFNFYIINSELGSSSTFSSINMDKGAISIGPRGILITSQVAAQRIDLQIPDQVFQFSLSLNGRERVTAQRDYINEWIYFTYPPADGLDYFPGQTLFYNYRDGSWALFNECYTTYGQFKRQSGQTWDDLTDFPWDSWNDPWDSGEQTLFQPEIIGGNQQGFVMIRDEGTDEDPSGYIEDINSSSIVTSPHHNLNDGDYIVITGALGTISSGVNGKIFSVSSPSVNAFTLNPTVPVGTYFGGGLFTRLYRPEIQTKQFPVSWEMARKTRIGVQQYLLTKTAISQITLLIFLSQDSTDPFNDGPILPDLQSTNDSLIYSTILHTCTESTNLGLTPANSSLMMLPPGRPQAQIWHRMNTSLLGDTVQLGFTLSNAQMRTYSEVGSALTITGVTQANPAVVSVVNDLEVGSLIRIQGIVGMIELNDPETPTSNKVWKIIDQNPTTLTIDVNTTGFNAYISGGTATPVAPVFQTDEIELHSMVLALSPSQLLA